MGASNTYQHQSGRNTINPQHKLKIRRAFWTLRCGGPAHHVRPNLSAKAEMIIAKTITADNCLSISCISAFTMRQCKVMAKLHYGQVDCPFLALSVWWLMIVSSPTWPAWGQTGCLFCCVISSSSSLAALFLFLFLVSVPINWCSKVRVLMSLVF